MQGLRKMKSTINENREVRQYEPLIKKLANDYYIKYNKRYDIEDLEQVARLGVLSAIRSYDPQFKTKKITHYYNYANFYIKHLLRSDTGIIHVPIRQMSNPNVAKPSLVELDEYVNSNKIQTSDYQNVDDLALLQEYFSVLTDYQKDIIQKVYIEGYTYDELAKEFNVSRQAVNLAATNGMSKMKQYAKGVSVKTRTRKLTV
jgi:RNA polymerase sigma factor (sigma-70 family)